MTAPSEQAQTVDKAILAALTDAGWMTVVEVRHLVADCLAGGVNTEYVRTRLNALVAAGELVREEGRQVHPLKPGALRTIQVWQKVRP